MCVFFSSVSSRQVVLAEEESAEAAATRVQNALEEAKPGEALEMATNRIAVNQGRSLVDVANQADAVAEYAQWASATDAAYLSPAYSLSLLSLSPRKRKNKRRVSFPFSRVVHSAFSPRDARHRDGGLEKKREKKAPASKLALRRSSGGTYYFNSHTRQTSWVWPPVSRNLAAVDAFAHIRRGTFILRKEDARAHTRSKNSTTASSFELRARATSKPTRHSF